MMLDITLLRGAQTSPIGLCPYLTSEQRVRMRAIIKRLGWYSGDKAYPIEHPTELLSAKDAYYSVQGNYLNSSCPYCRRRIEVLNILLEETQYESSNN